MVDLESIKKKYDKLSALISESHKKQSELKQKALKALKPKYKVGDTIQLVDHQVLFNQIKLPMKSFHITDVVLRDWIVTYYGIIEFQFDNGQVETLHNYTLTIYDINRYLEKGHYRLKRG